MNNSYRVVLRHIVGLRPLRRKDLSVLRISINCELSPKTVKRAIAYLTANELLIARRDAPGIPYDFDVPPAAFEVLAEKDRDVARIS
jgi:hypothetical protein